MPFHFQRMVQGEGQSTGQPDLKKAPAPGGAKAKLNFRFLLAYAFSLRFWVESAMLQAKTNGREQKMEQLTTATLTQLPQVRALGRHTGRDPLTLFWTASGMELEFTGSELWVDLFADYEAVEPWVSVELNGAWVARFAVNPGKSRICLFRGMTPGKAKHLRLLKDVQAMHDDPAHLLQITGLEGRAGVQEYVAESPFSYEKNCLLYLPKTLDHCRRGSREEALMVANHIHSLICSTYGHTLVLFTSYTLMGSVYQILRNSLPFPMVEVWRHSQEEILRFKTMENGVLFAAGSCWEGVDFPGDMVSSLIIVKLPFAVPDPISEAEKETYDSLESYIQSIIVPDMQKKLRQGFGRAIRTETDTCVVSILDIRAVKGGKYHEDVMCALPSCRIAEELKEVQDFIRSRKGVEYYL